MKRKYITLLLILMFNFCLAQSKKDYRTIEDGVTQLINNADFIYKIKNIKLDELANMNLNNLFAEFVPEYEDFKIDKTYKIDINKIFFEKGKSVFNEELYKSIGKLLDLKTTDLESLKSLLSGNISPSLINNITKSTIGSDLNAMVNNPEGYLKSELIKSIGGSSAGENLINLGFNWLSNKEKEIEKQEEIEKQAKERRLAYEKIEKQYNDQQSKIINEALNKLNDAYINTLEKKYDKAIDNYTSAVNFYKQADGRDYEIMKCYQSRGYCKIGMNDYRGAIVDNYLALIICNKLLAQNKSPNTNSVLGSSDASRVVSSDNFEIRKKQNKTTTYIDKYKIITSRAYAKFLAGDFDAAIQDCKMALDEMKASNPEKYDWTKIDINENFQAGTTSLNIIMMASEEKSSIYNLIAITGLSYASQKKYPESENYLKYIKLIKVSDMPKFDFEDEQEMLFARNQLNGLPNYWGGQIFQTKAFVLIKLNRIKEALELYNYLTGVGWALQSYGGVDISKFYLSKATIYANNKEYNNSILCLDSAIDLMPKEVTYYKIRSDLKKLAGDSKGAIADLNRTAKTNSVQSNKQSFYSIQMGYNRSQADRNRNEMETYLLDAIKFYPDSAWTLTNVIDLSFEWMSTSDVGKIPVVYQKPILDAEKITELCKKVSENSNLGIVLNAIKYGLNKDVNNCFPFISKYLDIKMGYEGYELRKLNQIEKILPKLDEYPEYCSFAKTIIIKQSTCQTELMKNTYKNIIEGFTKGNNSMMYETVSDYYLKLGDFQNALLFTDKEIKAEGKQSFNKVFYPKIIKTKINALLALDRNKEAIQIAKKYLKPNKNYQILKEENGNKIEFAEYSFIKNIAQDYCGYDK